MNKETLGNVRGGGEPDSLKQDPLPRALGGGVELTSQRRARTRTSNERRSGGEDGEVERR